MITQIKNGLLRSPLHKVGGLERYTTGGVASAKWLHSTNGAAIGVLGGAEVGSIVEHWELSWHHAQSEAARVLKPDNGRADSWLKG